MQLETTISHFLFHFSRYFLVDLIFSSYFCSGSACIGGTDIMDIGVFWTLWF